MLRRAAASQRGAFDRLLAAALSRAAARGLIPPAPEGAIDSTGFEVRHVSGYFSLRSRRHAFPTGHPWPKLTVVCLTGSHLITGARVTEGPANDSPEFGPVVRQATGHVPLDTLLADKGYDAEANHRIAREDCNVRRTVIPVYIRCGYRVPARGRYRRQMQTRFPRRRYRQRWQVESVFSRIKRVLGSSLTARHRHSQERECLLRVLTYDLMILRLRWEAFNRATQRSRGRPSPWNGLGHGRSGVSAVLRPSASLR